MRTPEYCPQCGEILDDADFDFHICPLCGWDRNASEEKGLTEDDIWYCNRFANGNDNAGYLVKTKNGLTGKTKHSDSLVNGKQIVYIEKDGKSINMLCDPDTLTVYGFID